MTQITKTLFSTKVLVKENERVLALKNGQFDRILKSGKHMLAGITHPYEFYPFNLNQPVFISEYTNALLRERADIAKDHLTIVETGLDEVALIMRDGKLYAVQKPENRGIFWTDAGPWDVEKIEIDESLEIPKSLSTRIGKVNSDILKRFVVVHGQVGLLYIDGELTRSMDPGVHAFWNVGKAIDMKIVDTREHALDVNAQEILTKDRVSIRVNLSATYRVTDPLMAVTEVKDFEDSLYRALQYAFRQTLATKTLDEVLAKKGVVDTQAAKGVKTEMAKIGLDVSAITIKDVILPGEMRDILNTVVTAEKEAEANVIRRREETNATRALLNTAKLMADNPAMMRLKELEALESIAEKVDTLTVHNGTAGLMEDLVSLKVPNSK